MHFSFSMSNGGGDVDGQGQPDSVNPMSIDDAVYHVVHGGPGGVAALAARMGLPMGTLTHKANPNNATHFLRPTELVAAQALSGQAHVLHAMAAALGYVCTRATPDQAGGEPIEAVMRLEVAHADFLRALADAVLVGDGQVNRNQLRRAEYMGQELIAAAGHAVAMLRGRMRAAPVVDY